MGKDKEADRKGALKGKLQALKEAIDARNGDELKVALEALYADETCTQEDVEQILEPLIKKDPEGVFEFLEENVEEPEEEEPKDNRKGGERVFNQWKHFDRRFMYFMFRVGMMGYGPGFRLLKTVFRMGALSDDPRKYAFGIATLTYK